MLSNLKDQDLLSKKYYKSNKHLIYLIPMEEDQLIQKVNDHINSELKAAMTSLGF